MPESPAPTPTSGTACPSPPPRPGLRDLAREDVRVSPSRLEALETCQLNWVIGDLGGDPGSTTAGLGTIIHAALEHADGADEEALWQQVVGRWGELEFEAGWIEDATRRQARDMVRRLHAYLRRFDAAGGGWSRPSRTSRSRCRSRMPPSTQRCSAATSTGWS
ncbi:PD-(D/E)XK nuclease family protein [Microbacterium elymi]|uniref:PD-(D/E)XK nuclease family protein n=1 Tax=Microbacterium elymi TaxID=2909587 RepID=A0ABY5NMY1_9MICO|nr:PD-(D/E)XK nuclease family protein [Microbacterium elymi]UUT36488.1 PD-(D/E)XK nuclease family protein [Microbacterium elymi]